MSELYNLITLLKPGQLGGEGDFAANFVADRRIPKNEAKLHEALGQVMIRNRRSDGGVEFTKRIVTNVPLRLSPEEMALYEGVTDYVRSTRTARPATWPACFPWSPFSGRSARAGTPSS